MPGSSQGMTMVETVPQNSFPPRGVTGLLLVDSVLTWDWPAFATALVRLM